MKDDERRENGFGENLMELSVSLFRKSPSFKLYSAWKEMLGNLDHSCTFNFNVIIMCQTI
jgi:hypothetical protein